MFFSKAFFSETGQATENIIIFLIISSAGLKCRFYIQYLEQYNWVLVTPNEIDCKLNFCGAADYSFQI